MGEVADGHSVLFFDVGKERSFIIDLEIENAVLVRQLEACGVDSRGGGRGRWLKC